MKKINKSLISIIIMMSLVFPTLLSFLFYKNSHELNYSDSIDHLMNSQHSGGGYIMDTEAIYSWDEISLTGTNMTLSESDNDYEAISFTSWNFTFYETEYDTIYVSSNGWMSFTYSTPTSPSGNIPDYTLENLDCVALYWVDLLTDDLMGGKGSVYYEFLTSPNRLVIEYDNIGGYDPDFSGTFEVIFYELGNIKFQYKNLDNHTFYSGPAGLDHGDGFNYNSFDEYFYQNPSISSKAIDFTFDQMIEWNYTMGVETNDEYGWILTKLNDAKMESFFGTNWEQLFGLLPNPNKADKMKINITSITENSTHWEIDYNIWDWENRITDFSTTLSSSDTIIYRREPLNYTQPHNMTNIIPFFTPKPVPIYLGRYNLTDYYGVNTWYGPGEVGLNYMDSKNITGDDIYISIDALYNDEGLLRNMLITWQNQSEQLEIYKMETLTSIFSEESSIRPSVSDEISFLVLDVNDTAMEAFFGTNWEQDFGLPLNPSKNDKTKINISSIADNTTHWEINYSMWDWIARDDPYTSLASQYDSLLYRQDPFDYTEPHNFTNLLPLILPKPPELYTIYSNLDNGLYATYSSMSSEGPLNLPTRLSIYKSDGFELVIGVGAYTWEGILQHLSIYTMDYMMNITVLFNMITFFEGSKPSYVGINQSDTYEYGVYECPRNAPSGGIALPYPSGGRRIKQTIDFISGEDSYIERALVLSNFSIMDQYGVWTEFPYNTFTYPGMSYGVNYVVFNVNDLYSAMQQQFPYYVAVGTNFNDWVTFFETFLEVMTYGPGMQNYTFTALSNGINITIEYLGDIQEILYTYTPEGLLDVMKMSYNGKEVYSIRLNDFDYVIPECDPDDPIITINTPIPDTIYTDTAPVFNIEIEELFLNSTWYSLDGGVTNHSFTLNGSISESLWDALPSAPVTITFYADDIAGNVGSASVLVDKDLDDPIITINEPENNLETTSAPSFDLTIVERNLDTIWYTLDDGITNITCGTSGTIDQTIWANLVDGTYTLKFYAIDTVGNLGSSEVTVIKMPGIPSYDTLLLTCITLISITVIIWKFRRRTK